MNNQALQNKFLSLPIYQQKHRIIEALEHHQIIVVESNTGSGKTTQLPLILLEHGYNRDGLIIGMTEPRRIAAVSVAQYVQTQLVNTPSFLHSLGDAHQQTEPLFVGYKIRFEDKTTERTKIKIMTDGILLQEFKKDPYLSHYSTIIIDEAHERSLNIDFILGLIKELCSVRSSLKVIISSATINTALFSTFFFHCPIIKVEAPSYPIQTFFSPSPQKSSRKEKLKKKKNDRFFPRERMSFFEIDSDVLIAHIVTIVQQSLQKKEGDILIFLAGEKQIKDCMDALHAIPQAHALHILPLYGRLDNRSQELVFAPAPANTTKIVIATNIAETSITIDTIKVVIDSGRVKRNTYHHDTYITTLDEIAISRASALQRKGRAGRTSPGVCYHLYRKQEFEALEPFSTEEIHRTDLSEVILRMAYQGIKNFEKFPFISPPKKQSVHASIAMLQELDALDKKQLITDIGSLMSEFPLLPIHARMLVEGIQQYPDVLDAIITVVSFLSTPNPFLLPIGEEVQARKAHRSLSVQDNDFLSYINIFTLFTETHSTERAAFCEQYYLDEQIMYEIYNVYTQLRNQVSEKGVPIGTQHHKEKIICAIMKGLVFNICILEKARHYCNRRGEKIYIHPGSMLFDQKQLPAILIAGEIVQTSKKFARSASGCRINWIQNVAPHIYQELQNVLKEKKDTHTSKQRQLSQGTDSSKQQSPVHKKEQQMLSIANTTYTLQYIHEKKVLLLTWKEMKQMAKYISSDELYRFGRVRCLVSIKQHSYLPIIKLSNIPALSALEKILLPPLTTLPLPYAPSKESEDSDSIADNKTQHALVEGCMSLYVKHDGKKASASSTTTQYPMNVLFCSLETGKHGSRYIDLSTHFLTSLYNSMRSIELLIEEQNDKKHIAKAQKVYAQLHAAYQLLEKHEG